MSADMAQVAIIGGGFTGASAAVQLVRRSPRPIKVTVVEPRAALGHGLAYAATDPDHRLNATLERHAVDPQDPQALLRWVQAERLQLSDPQAWLSDGRAFIRRRDFGRFVASTVATHARMPNGSTIQHLRGQALRLEPCAGACGNGWCVHTDTATTLHASLVLLATGNPAPRLPGFVQPALATWPQVVSNPLAPGALAAIHTSARVLVLGSGLTALDALATLLRRKPQAAAGSITVVSRHGLRPMPQPGTEQLPLLTPQQAPFEPPGGPMPGFVAALGASPGLRPLLRALRRQTVADAAAGLPWLHAFGALREAVWRIWPELPAAQRQQYMRHLRVWYDVHRFLSPPQTEGLVRAAQLEGRVHFMAARVCSVEPGPGGQGLRVRWHKPGPTGGVVDEAFDALVNCTGIDSGGHTPSSPLLRQLLSEGWLTADASGVGFAVDSQLRAVAANGQASNTLRVAGPPAAGARGDPIGAGYIAMHLSRVMPSLLAWLYPGLHLEAP